MRWSANKLAGSSLVPYEHVLHTARALFLKEKSACVITILYTLPASVTHSAYPSTPVRLFNLHQPWRVHKESRISWNPAPEGAYPAMRDQVQIPWYGIPGSYILKMLISPTSCTASFWLLHSIPIFILIRTLLSLLALSVLSLASCLFHMMLFVLKCLSPPIFPDLSLENCYCSPGLYILYQPLFSLCVSAASARLIAPRERSSVIHWYITPGPAQYLIYVGAQLSSVGWTNYSLTLCCQFLQDWEEQISNCAWGLELYWVHDYLQLGECKTLKKYLLNEWMNGRMNSTKKKNGETMSTWTQVWSEVKLDIKHSFAQIEIWNIFIGINYLKKNIINFWIPFVHFNFPFPQVAQ